MAQGPIANYPHMTKQPQITCTM